MAKGNYYSRPGRYELQECVLTDFSGNTVDMAYLISSFTVLESINSMFNIYEFTIVDAVNILERFTISGNEKIELTLVKKDTPDGSEEQITKHLILTKIEAYARPSNEGQAYKFKAITDTAFKTGIKRLSRSDSDTPTEMISRLWDEVSFKTDLVVGDDAVGNMKIVYPNHTYMDTFGLLLSRAANANGSPFYLYDTLWGDANLITDEKLVGESPVDKYVFLSEDQTSPHEEEFDKNRLRIKSFNSKLGVSNYEGIKRGAFFSTVYSLDISNKTFVVQDYHIDGSSATPMDSAGRFTLDSGFTIGDEPATEFLDSKQIFLATNLSGFEEGATNLHQESVNYIADRNFVGETQFAASHSIDIYGDSRVQAGKMIEIEIPPAMDPEDVTVPIDEYISGVYLVATVMHTFDKDGYYNQTLGLRKNYVKDAGSKFSSLRSSKGYG